MGGSHTGNLGLAFNFIDKTAESGFCGLNLQTFGLKLCHNSSKGVELLLVKQVHFGELSSDVLLLTYDLLSLLFAP
jgi:hypothetical protein